MCGKLARLVLSVLVFVLVVAGAGKAADIELHVDGKKEGSERIEKTIPLRVSLDETLDIGEDTGTPVSEEYRVPFKFTGEIEKVVISLKK